MEKRNIDSVKEYISTAKKHYDENLNLFLNYIFKKYFGSLMVIFYSFLCLCFV